MTYKKARVLNGLGHKRNAQGFEALIRCWPQQTQSRSYVMDKVKLTHTVRIFKKNRPGRSGPIFYILLTHEV